MAEIKIKNLFLFLFLLYLISFPFINIFVAFMNGRKKPGFFEITYKEELSGYDFEVSKETVEALTENLVTKKIRFKEKYLENRLKVLSILSFRRILHYQFVSKQERFKLDSVTMQVILNDLAEVNFINNKILKLIERDILNYIKSGKENLSNFDFELNEDEIVLKKTYQEPKKYESLVIDIDNF